MDAPILIPLKWDLKFHVHSNASYLAMGVMLAQNPIGICNQRIAYAFWLLNNVKRNYTTTEREAFTMVYALRKFCHYLLVNRFIFYVDFLHPISLPNLYVYFFN
jgi:hypothetical protein